MRSALVVCLLVAMAAGAALAQPAPGPDEVSLAYLKAAYVPPDLSKRIPWDDASYCRAYSMLARASRDRIGTPEYVASAREMAARLLDSQIGAPRFDGDFAIVQVRYVLRYFFVREPQAHTEFFRLAREEGAWRLVMGDEEFARRQAAAAEYRRTGMTGSRAVPPTICS